MLKPGLHDTCIHTTAPNCIQAFLRDTRRASGGISLLCYVFWACSHLLWRLISSEAGNARSGDTGSTDIVGDGVATPAWVWVDLGIAWAIAPAAGGCLQLSLWGSIVPSWLCVTGALAFGLLAEEVRAEETTERFACAGYCAISGLLPFWSRRKRGWKYFLRWPGYLC